jgi:hypothetical protein
MRAQDSLNLSLRLSDEQQRSLHEEGVLNTTLSKLTGKGGRNRSPGASVRSSGGASARSSRRYKEPMERELSIGDATSLHNDGGNDGSSSHGRGGRRAARARQSSQRPRGDDSFDSDDLESELYDPMTTVPGPAQLNDNDDGSIEGGGGGGAYTHPQQALDEDLLAECERTSRAADIDQITEALAIAEEGHSMQLLQGKFHRRNASAMSDDQLLADLEASLNATDAATLASHAGIDNHVYDGGGSGDVLRHADLRDRDLLYGEHNDDDDDDDDDNDDDEGRGGGSSAESIGESVDATSVDVDALTAELTGVEAELREMDLI